MHEPASHPGGGDYTYGLAVGDALGERDGLSVGDVDGESVGESVGFGLRGLLQPSSVHPSAFHAGLLLGDLLGFGVLLQPSSVHPSAFHAGLLLGEREGLRVGFNEGFRVGLKANVVKQARIIEYQINQVQ